MMYEISHRTKYSYEEPVHQSSHLLHLTPRPTSGQVVHRHSILIEPAPSSRRERIDYFGNPSSLITIERKHSTLRFLSSSTIEVTRRRETDIENSPDWETVAESLHSDPAGGDQPSGIIQYTCGSAHTTPTADILDYARQSFLSRRPLLAAVTDLTQRIFDDFTFDNDATSIETSPADFLEGRRGVCQDYTHFALACLRALRLPARYVSGYLLTYPPEGKSALVGTDASHAWLSVWCPKHGWIDFDPTNNLMTSDEHITVALGRDFADVSPINGVVIGGGAHDVRVVVDVRKVPD